ncbi:MAG: HAD-IC family P-type ATPase, partial [Methylococcales bacterium]
MLPTQEIMILGILFPLLARKQEQLMQSPKKNWHSMQQDALLAELRVDTKKGLTEQEVQQRRDQYGGNRLSPRKGKSPLLLLLAQFHQPLVYILLLAGSITAFLQEWVDSSVIFGVVVINAIIGFVQEANALKAIDALSKALSISTTVRREGQQQLLQASELVPGDIVYLQSGDKVPADLRLLQSRDLQSDESALTGESVPVEKQVTTLSKVTLLPDRCNMLYSSTLITYGTGLAVVVETGDRTEIGLINRMIANAT